MVARVDVSTLRCYRCGSSWTPRRSLVRICPRCKSPHWDAPWIRVPRAGKGLGVEDIIGPKRDAIRAVARKYGASNLRVFGSIARYDAGPRSDADFLVEFRRRWHGRKSRIYLMGRDLERILGRPVDIVREETLHWFIQPQVVSEAVPI